MYEVACIAFVVGLGVGVAVIPAIRWLARWESWGYWP
jgi:hypothetical protein